MFKKKEALVAELRRKREAFEVDLLKRIREFEVTTGVSVASIALLKLATPHPELGSTQKVQVEIKL